MSDLPSPAPTPPSGDDWPSQAADTIVNVVGQVRDRTTGQAITASRTVVYGLLAGILGLTAAVLAAILGMRILIIGIDAILGIWDADKPGRAAWIADLLVGLVLVVAGAWAWKKATAASTD